MERSPPQDSPDEPPSSPPVRVLSAMERSPPEDSPDGKRLKTSSSPPSSPPSRRLVRAARVLRDRAMRFIVVLDRIQDPFNVAAAMRTIEALGVQHVWLVEPPLKSRKKTKIVAKGAEVWLSVRRFENPSDCAAALQGWTVWVTADGDGAVPLTTTTKERPAQLALVIGREADGVSPELLAIADRKFYIPLSGFTTSLNLSVATGILVHTLLSEKWFPHLRGDDADPVTEFSQKRTAILHQWRPHLAKNSTAQAEFDTFFFNDNDDDPMAIQPQRLLLGGGGGRPPGVSSGSWAPAYIRERESKSSRE